MKQTNNIVATVATSLLCIIIAAVPAVVLSFSGHVVNNDNHVAAAQKNYQKRCWIAHHHDIHCVQRQMTDEESSYFSVEEESIIGKKNAASSDGGGVVDTERRVSKRKRILKDVFRRVFRRQSLPMEHQEDEVDEGATTSTITDDVAPIEEVVDESIDDDSVSLSTATSNNTTTLISSTRQATASVDLSGTWSPIVTSSFKSQYDDYLKNCSQSFVFRKVIVNGIEYQRETIRQLNNGQHLEIIAQNPAGNWNRTLFASDSNNPINTTIVDPDKDTVNVEAWWEDNGLRHKSVLRGKPRVNGGVFETVRYLDKEEEGVLVCESKFLPSEFEGSSSSFKYGRVLWRFRRVA